MKKVLVTMALMTTVMVFGGGLVSLILTEVMGGGIEQSFIYPIYGGIILLSGIIVGCTSHIIEKLEEVKNKIEK